MEDGERGIVLLGEGNGEGQSVLGVIRKIGGKEDPFDIGHAPSSFDEELYSRAPEARSEEFPGRIFSGYHPNPKTSGLILNTPHNLSRWKMEGRRENMAPDSDELVKVEK
jgi:hypothetical protein